MSLHLRPVPRRYDFQLEEIKRDTTNRLRFELEEEALSQQIVDRHNERVRRNAAYRQNGGA